MSTRFELLLYGDDPVRLRAAGEEAASEIERLDRQLSLYRPESDISWINSCAAIEPVKVDPRLFNLLQIAKEISEKTDGAFDITIAPLMRAWGFINDSPKAPMPADLDAARALVGMHHVRLNEADFTVSFDRRGVELDLGAIGKGYAIECAVEILKENGITSALIHGGTSTIYGIGSPPGQDAWNVAVRGCSPSSQLSPAGGEGVELRDSSLSVSAPHGKSFIEGDIEYGHVIDPRTGQSVSEISVAAVVGPSPTVGDALSTALLVLGKDWLPMPPERFPGYLGFVF